MFHEKMGKHGTQNRRRYQVAQSWLNRLYIHFNVPPTRITDLVRNASGEKIYWYWTVTFVCVFAFINLVCVQSVIQLMTPFITVFIMIKDFHFFFKSDNCPRPWNCNFLCVICIQANLLCYFLLNERAARFKSSYTFPQPNLSVF